MARRAGIKRISKALPKASTDIVKQFLQTVLKRAVTYNKYAKRKTMSVDHILSALAHVGVPVVGVSPK